MKYNVISGDTHVDLTFLPEDLFVSNAPNEWKDRMPHVVEGEDGKRWKAGDIQLGPAGSFRDLEFFSQEMIDRTETMKSANLFDSSEGGYHPTTPELRLKDQELDGIDADVIYGLFFVSSQLKDHDQITQIFKVYNDWIAEFCKTHPDRFAGMACIPNHDPQVAADEVRRAATLGLKGAEFGASLASKPIYHRDWDVLWEASAETGLSLSFHTAGLPTRRVDESETSTYEREYAAISTTMFQLSGVEAVASTIFSGACERFPTFKFVLGECGVSWLPYVIDRMDHEGEGQPGLTLKPSEYWHRQGYSTFQKEAVAGELVHLIGEENVIWGSDYPHPDGVWPDSQNVIAENFKNMKNPDAKQKIICENAGKLYGFM